ncbi:D-tyrosyl-tRNA(Tyr) deacylase [Paenibacillus swuensis]|uniref:D-aminoacyl-tRNA deacylase n=1 Tax=Paenibacillus swuensis TaxID=1178515 RepID=A0A172TJH6_9BACL|nr:D-aminoacyl-tRNA deacylase [Paenibacillus swuensis]ANE47201.1 D-tyrosyl-tRNA(Tyr) deacylase [Paenibacillus swuensis]
MKVVLQRSKAAQVSVDGQVIGSIEQGFVLLVGVTHEDTNEDVRFLADKVAGLRIFDDADGRMNLAIQDVNGQILSISQFTLYGDCRKGRRPNFMAAARPEPAEALYLQFNEHLREKGLNVETGQFGAMMDVSLVNWGPVTLILDSKER